MKTIEVTIKGLSPLLMHSPSGMLQEPTQKVKSKSNKIDFENEAKACAYINDKGLFIPSSAIKGTILNASSWKKVGKLSLKPILAGAIHIEPFEIPLGTNKYEIDLRTVVIQRNRVVKARPRVWPWTASFNIIFDESMGLPDESIKDCLTEAGKRIGILDFRPQRGGEFGQFEITKWNVKEK